MKITSLEDFKKKVKTEYPKEVSYSSDGKLVGGHVSSYTDDAGLIPMIKRAYIYKDHDACSDRRYMSISYERLYRVFYFNSAEDAIEALIWICTDCKVDKMFATDVFYNDISKYILDRSIYQ